ncbi:MAG: hypothetical protein E6Q97_37070 [Desulfurellales bacterium]|nr:MAG: hypothetical protein E6Q97_37070 [Desulfurellales bacterium]
MAQGDWISCKVNHTGHLTIGEVNYGVVRPGIIIKVHRDQLAEAEQYCSPMPGVPTVGAKIDKGPMGRFAFFPTGRYGYLAGATRVQAWRFYFLPVALAETAKFPFEAVPSDQSRVGTRLKDWFAKLGFMEKPGCSCKRIRMMLDAANLAFIDQHLDAIVDQICVSAASLNVSAPRPIVSRMLKAACWMERSKVSRSRHA